MNAEQTTQVEPIRGDGPQAPPRQPPGSNGNSKDQHGHGGHETEIPKDLPKPSTSAVILVAVILAACLAGLFILGWIPHHSAEDLANADAQAQAGGLPAVTVARPKV